MKTKGHKGMGSKKSSVVHPGTGSGHGVKAGSTRTPTSEPSDKHGLGRRPPSALK